jgi:tetratricopeptide (TPR) repeat protein
MVLGAFILTAAAILAQGPAKLPAAAEQSVARLLADQWIRTGRAVLESEPITVQKIRLVTLLAEMSTETAPDYETAWRFLLSIADVSERVELQRQAVQRLAEINPTDDVIRLRRLNHVIDDLDTAEERVALYERLLDPSRRDEIGPAVASRLALDLALLKQSQGDLGAFSTWLAEATAIDASNRKAAALAAGFFRANVKDPTAEAELLISLVMADPTDAMSMLTLGQLLLERGAYAGAQRLYRQAVKVAQYTGSPPITDELVADAAIALWGQGDTSSAMRMIVEHQRIKDHLLRIGLKRDRPEMTPLDLAKENAVLAPTLSTVRAMIQKELGGELAGRALQAAVLSYDEAIATAASAEPADPAARGGLLLEQASVMYWLGADIEEAGSRVTQAAALQPLTPQAEARFDGWHALRSGDTATARAKLAPLAENDPLAAIGFALALIEEGERRESARQLLSVVRKQPGTLLGVWAYTTLAGPDMLKQRFAVSETAAQLDGLTAKIPAAFDRYVENPTLALSLRIRPEQVQYGPLDPVIVTIEITNHTSVPMSIDRNGPIHPHVAIIVSPQVARVKLPTELRPLIIDIDRKLRLAPRERLEIKVDLRQSQLATVLDTHALRGATVSVRGLLNFMVTPQGALRAGILGSEVTTERIRIDGVRMSRAWIEDALAAVTQPDSLNDLIQLAMLAPVAAAGPAQGAPAEDVQLLADVSSAMVEAFAKLSPTAQAWLLGVLPRTSSMEPVRALARRSTDPWVQLSYIIHQSTGLTDPVFDVARRGEHAKLRELAELFPEALQLLAEPAAP